MKRLTKALLLVAAMFTLSCTTDITEDLGLQLGNGEALTSVTLSLEESRTQLGEKSGDLYPLYWSEGDAIAINGVTSTALGAEFDGYATANFNFADATLARPYNIVYPAPKEDAKIITETIKVVEDVVTTNPETGESVTTPTEVDKEVEVTLYPITFPSSQVYAGAKLAEGAAPMYGYADVLGEDEAAAAISLNHLTGILNFNIKGSETLSRIVVTSEKGAISGTYYVRCETGQLVVKEESTSNQIVLSFGEGLTLNPEEATPVYVTVPKGSYGVFVATLHTIDGKKMTVRFDSDSKPISVGKIREFAPFTFVENAVEEGTFEIYDFADLQKFAEIATASKFYPYTEAKLMENITLPEGAEWTPIEGFRYTFNGNNKSIIGLNAPLFGTTYATIKDLTLEGVNIVSNNQLIMGAIACTLTSNGMAAKASLTNCKAVGTFTVSNLEWTPTSSQDKDVTIVNYGGLVGRSLGADLINCTNQVAITVSNMTSLNNNLVVYSGIGGVVGYVNTTTLDSGDSATTALTKCSNDAAINYLCTSGKANNVQIGRPYIGGLMGYGTNGTLTECSNTANGTVSLNSNFYGGGGASGGLCVGGLVGFHSSGYTTNCTNYGAVSADGTYKSICIGGIGGYITYCYNDELHNHGEVVVEETARIRGILAGGIAGSFYGDGSKSANDQYFKNCSNNAALKILASSEENWTASTSSHGAYYYRIGGITGFGRTITPGECTNNGDITISGNIKIATHSEYSEEAIGIAGCIGFKTSGSPSGKWENNGDITVDATFSFDDDANSGIHPIAVAGVYGPTSGISAKAECVNNGAITFNGKYEGAKVPIYIGGIYAGGNSENGYYNKTVSNAKNTGDITIGATAKTTKNVYVGGIQAYSASTTVPTSIENSGDINVDAKASIAGTLYVGGIYGRFGGGNLANLTNSGNINIAYTTNGKLCVGGIASYNVAGKSVTDVVNTGNITLSGTFNKSVNVGGIFAEMASANTSGAGLFTRVVNGELDADGKPLDNKGKITMSGTCSYDVTGNAGTGVNALSIAGLCASNHYQYRPGNMDDCHNYGDFEISGTIKGRCYMAGISVACPIADKTVTNCSNCGDVTFSGTLQSSTNGILYQGGFSYTIDKGITFTNFQQKGNFTVTDKAVLSGTIYIGGLSYNISAAILDGCSNSGSVSHNGQHKGGSVYIGGLASYTIKSVTIKNNYTNSGDMSFGGSYSANGGVYIAGLGCINGTAQQFTEAGLILNRGEISYTGASTHKDGKVRVGGIFANIPASVTTITAGDKVNFVNLGKVSYSGTISNKENASVGGISAIASSPITGAKAYCDVDAPADISHGWITGSPRSTTLPTAVNCHIGGIRLAFDSSDFTYTPTALFDDSDYFNYIYGGSTDWTGTNDYDGCKYLASDPTL